MIRWSKDDITRVKLIDKIVGGNSMVCACGGDMVLGKDITMCSACWSAVTPEECHEAQQVIFKERFERR